MSEVEVAGLAAGSSAEIANEPKIDKKNTGPLKRTGTINKAKQLEEQK